MNTAYIEKLLENTEYGTFEDYLLNLLKYEADGIPVETYYVHQLKMRTRDLKQYHHVAGVMTANYEELRALVTAYELFKWLKANSR